MQTKKGVMGKRLVLRKQSGKSTFLKSIAKNRVKIRKMKNLEKLAIIKNSKNEKFRKISHN